MPITIPLPDGGQITVVVNDNSGQYVITPLYTPPPLPADILGYVIGYLFTKRIINPTITQIFISYFEKGGILESAYKLKVNGSITMAIAKGSSLHPFADIEAVRASGVEKACAIKMTETWSKLKGLSVVVEMAGSVMPVKGVLSDFTEDGIKLDGFDLPIKGVIIGLDI